MNVAVPAHARCSASPPTLRALVVLVAAATIAGCSLFTEPESTERTAVVNRPQPPLAPVAPSSSQGAEPATTAARPTPLPEASPAPVPAQPPVSTRHYQLGPATNALVTQAHAATTKGDYFTAMSTLERAVRIEPRNPLVWIEMAKIRLASGEAVQAESVARKAVALSEGDQRTSNDAWKQVALALRAQGRNPEAAAAETRANRPYSDGG